MIEPKRRSGKVKVYYNVLEGKKDGKPPTFYSESKTGLQIIVKKRNKVSNILIVIYKRCKFLAECKLKKISLTETERVHYFCFFKKRETI